MIARGIGVYYPNGMPEIIGDVPAEEKKQRFKELMGNRG